MPCCLVFGRPIHVEVWPESVPSLSTTFHAYMQMDLETLADYSRVLKHLHSCMAKATVTWAEEDVLVLLRDKALKEQFVRGVNDRSVRQELRQIALCNANESFLTMRDEELSLLGDNDEVQRTVRVHGAETEPDPVHRLFCRCCSHSSRDCPPRLDPILAMVCASVVRSRAISSGNVQRS